ncbi:MAG: hypothetical protein M3O70_16180 [Actinomycetota bacterium]|nr:hypothetical protein [Actinomycetota bacterium]
MANRLLTNALAAGRRAMRGHQSLPPDRQPTLWRLIVGGIGYLLGQLRNPRRLVPALVAAGLITLGLSPATPGPVAQPVLLAPLAIFAAAVAAWAGPRIGAGHHDGPGGGGVPAVLWQAIPGIGTVVLAAAGVALSGWLLAVLISALF